MKIKFVFSLLAVVLFATAGFSQYGIVIKDTAFSTNPGGTLKFAGVSGDIIINKGSNEKLTFKVTSKSDIKDKMEIEYSVSNNEIAINVKLKEKVSDELKYELSVPGSYNMNVLTSGGDIITSDISGKCFFKSSGGDVTIAGCMGELDITTSGGDILINGFDGNVSGKTSGGDLVINAKNGTIEATTSGGDILLNYSGENKGISLASSGGDIISNLPSDIKAELFLVTSAGDVTVDMPNLTEVNKEKNKFMAKVNGGGEKIKAATSGGDIIIKKK